MSTNRQSYPEIEEELERLLKGEERSFMDHFYRLQFLIMRKVEDRQLRGTLYQEADLFRKGIAEELRKIRAPDSTV